MRMVKFAYTSQRFDTTTMCYGSKHVCLAKNGESMLHAWMTCGKRIATITIITCWIICTAENLKIAASLSSHNSNNRDTSAGRAYCIGLYVCICFDVCEIHIRYSIEMQMGIHNPTIGCTIFRAIFSLSIYLSIWLLLRSSATANQPASQCCFSASKSINHIFFTSRCCSGDGW